MLADSETQETCALKRARIKLPGGRTVVWRMGTHCHTLRLKLLCDRLASLGVCCKIYDVSNRFG